MRTLLASVAVCSFTLAAADMPFTGTWRLDLNKMQAPKKATVTELGNGRFRCLTCDPPVDVKADGQDQAVKGNPGFDTLNVKVVDDKTVEQVSKLNGKVVEKMKFTLAADGNHATIDSTFSPQNNSAPVTSKEVIKRVGPAKQGMHASSGSWVLEKTEQLSDNGREFSYEQSPDGLKCSDPTGFSYSAKFDGKDYPVTGANTLDAVVVKRVNDRTIEEIVKYQGKVKNTTRLTVSPDGKTLTIAWQSSNGFSGTDLANKK